MTPFDTDLLIIGAGCAGLALGRELALNKANLRVLIVDSKAEFLDDRTWCFWRPEQHELSSIVTTAWKTWRFSDCDTSLSHTSENLFYHHIRASAYYQHALSNIETAPNIELRLQTTGSNLQQTEDGVRFETSSGPIFARYVVDTRPPQRDHMLKARMFQVFSGAEVDISEGMIDADNVGLMASMETDQKGFRFTYLLPFDTHTALIETTRFSPTLLDPTSLDAELQNEIDGIAQGNNWVITRRERGVLPMGLPQPKSRPKSRIARAGAGGGALRPGSGYGFLRMQSWASACARSLLKGQGVIPHPPEPFVRSTADKIFLRALLSNPERSAEFFLSIANGLNPDGFARFMCDEAQLLDWVKVAFALPKRPFLRAALEFASDPRREVMEARI